MKNIIGKYINVVKPTCLTESNSLDGVKVYMNTWSNYNESGADLSRYGISDGWMTVDEALDFCKKYAEDEPFVNDIDSSIINVSEYDNPVEALDKIKKLSELDEDALDVVLSIMETDLYISVTEAIEIQESGDYIFFPGISTDEELGEAYVDMVGFSGVSHIEQYIDEDRIKEYIQYQYDEQLDDDTLNQLVDDEIEANVGNENFYNTYFDYEKLGTDLQIDGFMFVDKGAIVVN